MRSTVLVRSREARTTGRGCLRRGLCGLGWGVGSDEAVGAWLPFAPARARLGAPTGAASEREHAGRGVEPQRVS